MKTPSLISTFIAASMFASAVSALAADKPTLEGTLDKKISFEWNDNSLELGLLALVAKVKVDHPEFAIKILGEDLKLDGITRNQRIRGLKVEDRTIADVLTAMMLKAYPGSAIADPSDPRLKLVWAIAADPDEPGVRTVVITTRAAAQRRGDKLPEIFERK